MNPPLAEHFFRHEYGKLVATLCRRVGATQMEAVEDAAQQALLTAVERWGRSGPPHNPSAWLHRVAHNALIDSLRKQRGHQRILQDYEEPAPSTQREAKLASELDDDLLRMLFVCCDPAIPRESQLVLALKTLCGFGVAEIAARLFSSEAAVYKRLARARQGFSARAFEEAEDQRATRVSGVRAILYLLFTEGHLSSQLEAPIRRELCDEALRLGLLLAQNPTGQQPETFALVALMHLHSARLTSRQDGSGGLLLLEEQDRSCWDAPQIQEGLTWLNRSAVGDVFSRYHAEAAIAAEHCLAPSFAETRWDRVAKHYELLEVASPSPIHKLNRALAVAEAKGPEAGLALLEGFVPPSWLSGSYMWSAVLADLHHRAGHRELATEYQNAALASAPTPAIRAQLQRRLVQHRSPHAPLDP